MDNDSDMVMALVAMVMGLVAMVMGLVAMVMGLLAMVVGLVVKSWCECDHLQGNHFGKKAMYY